MKDVRDVLIQAEDEAALMTLLEEMGVRVIEEEGDKVLHPNWAVIPFPGGRAYSSYSDDPETTPHEYYEGFWAYVRGGYMGILTQHMTILIDMAPASLTPGDIRYARLTNSQGGWINFIAPVDVPKLWETSGAAPFSLAGGLRLQDFGPTE